MGEDASHALPDDPALASAASALGNAGYWAEVVDCQWRYAYVTDDLRLSFGGLLGLQHLPLGVPYFGAEAVDNRLTWRAGANSIDIQRAQFRAIGSMMLHDLGGDRDAFARLVDPRLRDVIDDLEPTEPAPLSSYQQIGMTFGSGRLDVPATTMRIHAADGRFAGTAIMYKPAPGMATLSTMAAAGDLGHFARFQGVAKAGRRPAALLFADLEASSPLSRRLSTASYFALGRRLVRAADRCVIDADGLVGRHVGDGVVAFFLTEHAGSESAAARNCIQAARALRSAAAEVAARSDLQPEEAVLRFGLHWGSTLYVGQIQTAGRSEVTALGDEVNEAARIEACASGGLALASKDLIERLEPEDAAALDLDPDRITYSPLGDLSTATEKARRDAPAVAVCEV